MKERERETKTEVGRVKEEDYTDKIVSLHIFTLDIRLFIKMWRFLLLYSVLK